jgi:RNA polymerase sigma factor (sigma-70 family)
VHMSHEVSLSVAGTDRNALIAALFDEHSRRLVGLARTLVDSRAEAEEVVQEAFERLVASFSRVDDPTKADRYLTVTVLNVARSRLRRRHTARRKAHLVDESRQQHEVVESVDRDQIERVRLAIRMLPKRQQQCIVLRFYSEATEQQIAATLGLAVGSVKTHLSRARAHLAVTLAAASPVPATTEEIS